MQRHININDRPVIDRMLRAGYTQISIADTLRFSKSAISKEISRNIDLDGVYRFRSAERKTKNRRRQSKTKYRKIENDIDLENNIIHYLIDKGKPTQNGTIERSHGEDQRKFYEKNKFKTVHDLKVKIIEWNEYYNNLEHCGLDGRTPNEVLYEHPPYVRA